MRTTIALAVLALSGCVFDPSVQAVRNDADPTAPDANPFTADADPNAPDANPNAPDANPNAQDAAPPLPLVGTGLVVRYFMNEAASGQGPTELVDTAPAPMPLPITYGQATYVEDNGNRGLHWANKQSTGKAQKAFGVTKLSSQITQASTVTIEVVVKIGDAGTGSDASQIAGFRGNNPDFMLTAEGDSNIYFYRPFGSLGATWEGVHSQERMVLHLVFNSDDGSSANRIQLYKNGVLLPKTTSSPPGQGQAVGLGGTTDSLIIGNSPNQDRSLEGTIYYVAMYNEALSESDVSNNATRLLANDDP